MSPPTSRTTTGLIIVLRAATATVDVVAGTVATVVEEAIVEGRDGREELS